VDNIGGASVQYDGFTAPMLAKAIVTPGETYHVRIAIADAGDNIFDSGVFLSIESMGGDSLLPVNPYFLAIPQPGTLDYQFNNETLWATKWEWDFGDGTTSTLRTPTHTYAAAGIYEVKLKASNWCSQKTHSYTINAVSGTETLAENVFSISPNPAQGSFVLKLADLPSARVRISTLDGRLISDKIVNNGDRITLDQYGKGVYTVQVITNEQVFSQRVVNIR
jgi:PKD domain/Secretion system C-terminal sorting domain